MSLDELLQAMRAGGRVAGEALAGELSSQLWRYFNNRFDHADAQDLTNNALEVIWKKLPSFEPQGPDSFRRWVLAIALREAKAARRANQREAAHRAQLAGSPVAPGMGPSSHVLRLERAALIREEFERLDDLYRRTLEHELSEGDVDSFAEREGIRPTTVRTRRVRGKQKIQRGVQAMRRTPPAARS